jgi:hypothetical protein
LPLSLQLSFATIKKASVGGKLTYDDANKEDFEASLPPAPAMLVLVVKLNFSDEQHKK